MFHKVCITLTTIQNNDIFCYLLSHHHSTSIADEYSNCSCGVALSYPSDLMVTISSASISVMQTIPKKGAIQAALRKLVLFEHSPDLPDSSYTSEIDVVVNDGIFESVTATVSILVNYQNIPPTVFTDSQQQVNNIINTL